eukprot:7318911-Pyramimonas_sp.AAC.1
MPAGPAEGRARAAPLAQLGPEQHRGHVYPGGTCGQELLFSGWPRRRATCLARAHSARAPPPRGGRPERARGVDAWG